MKILAVEFSSEDRGVAVVEVTESKPVVLGAVCERGGRRAIELVEQVLDKAHCEREAIDCLAIGLGPGSYTGIRGAIALAQGWQLGREVKLLGISSAECIATQAKALNLLGRVNVVIDAQREEYYLAVYDISTEGICEAVPLHLAPAAQVKALCQSGETVVGPDLAERLPEARILCPDAVTLGILAAGRTDYIAGEAIEPIYLRLTNYKKAPPIRVIS